MSKKMKTINIHGKEYVSVDERIKFFRSEEDYKGWSITSDFVELTDEHCTMKATITDCNGVVRATGSAKEIKGSSYINKTSYVENCETSAWGRALGNMGIGIDTSGIASAEEVKNAITQQNMSAPPKPPKLNASQYQAMIVAIGEGKTDVVLERMRTYKLTKTQESKLTELINKNN